MPASKAFVGSRFNDNLTGAGPDTTTTNGFNNLLVGGAGNDTSPVSAATTSSSATRSSCSNDLSVYARPPSFRYTTIANWKGTGENRPQLRPVLATPRLLPR